MKCFVTIVNGVLTILENHFIWDVWQGTEDDSKHGLEVKIKSNLKAQGSYTISIIYEFFFLSEFCFTEHWRFGMLRKGVDHLYSSLLLPPTHEH